MPSRSLAPWDAPLHTYISTGRTQHFASNVAQSKVCTKGLISLNQTQTYSSLCCSHSSSDAGIGSRCLRELGAWFSLESGPSLSFPALNWLYSEPEMSLWIVWIGIWTSRVQGFYWRTSHPHVTLYLPMNLFYPSYIVNHATLKSYVHWHCIL